MPDELQPSDDPDEGTPVETSGLGGGESPEADETPDEPESLG